MNIKNVLLVAILLIFPCFKVEAKPEFLSYRGCQVGIIALSSGVILLVASAATELGQRFGLKKYIDKLEKKRQGDLAKDLSNEDSLNLTKKIALSKKFNTALSVVKFVGLGLGCVLSLVGGGCIAKGLVDQKKDKDFVKRFDALIDSNESEILGVLFEETEDSQDEEVEQDNDLRPYWDVKQNLYTENIHLLDAMEKNYLRPAIILKEEGDKVTECLYGKITEFQEIPNQSETFVCKGETGDETLYKKGTIVFGGDSKVLSWSEDSSGDGFRWVKNFPRKEFLLYVDSEGKHLAMKVKNES